MPSPIFDVTVGSCRATRRTAGSTGGFRGLLALSAAVAFATAERPATAAPAGASAGAGATAAETAQARAKLREGVSALDGGSYEKALALFEEAFRLVPSPKIQFNMGLAHLGLARHAEAIEDFERFLAEAKDAPAPNRVEAEGHIAALRQRVGVVAITCDTDGADVQIDGRKRGSTPLGRKLYVAAGAHQLVIRQAGGGAPFVEDFTVAAGATVELVARLAGPRPAPVSAPLSGQASIAAGAAPRPAEPAAGPALQATQAMASPDAGSAGEPRRRRSWLPWAIAGGAAAVTAAVVLAIVLGGSTRYPDVDVMVPGD